MEAVVHKMTQLHACGLRFSIDDFGTGCSSLSYLKRLPIDELRIDRCFVHDAMTDPNDAIIVRTIPVRAESLSLKVVVEGVETPEQHRFLLDNRCRFVQRYLFGKPVPPHELTLPED